MKNGDKVYIAEVDSSGHRPSLIGRLAVVIANFGRMIVVNVDDRGLGFMPDQLSPAITREALEARYA